MQRHLVPAGLAYLDFAPGPGIAPFWKGIAALLGFETQQAFADGPVGLTMMRHARLRRAALSIVPWGVVVGAAHGWESIAQIVHESVQQAPGTTDRGWPRKKSFLYVDVGGERFQAVSEFHPKLDELPTLVRAFAAEAERSLALCLEPAGVKECVEPDSGRAFSTVLEAARDLLRTSAGKELFDVEASGYRSTARRPRAEAITLLRKLLRERGTGPDRAPLGAVIAAELGAAEVLEDLCDVMLSPSPIVAATCRAAALRLGASTTRCGKGRALRAFLDEDDLHALDRWSAGG